MLIHFRFDHVAKTTLIDAIAQVLRVFCDPIDGFGHLPLIAERLHQLATPVRNNEIAIDDVSMTSINDDIRVASELAGPNVSAELIIEHQLRTTLRGGASPELLMMSPTFSLSYSVSNSASGEDAFEMDLSASLVLKETTSGWDARFASDHPGHDERKVRAEIEALPNCVVYES